jgi:hypothetical protein
VEIATKGEITKETEAKLNDICKRFVADFIAA